MEETEGKIQIPSYHWTLTEAKRNKQKSKPLKLFLRITISSSLFRIVGHKNGKNGSKGPTAMKVSMILIFIYSHTNNKIIFISRRILYPSCVM